MSTKIEAVVFDVGETLIDETRVWTAWADWLGVPRFTFMAVFGAVIARGDDHRQVFEEMKPGFDLQAAYAARRAANNEIGFRTDDLYPDVEACFRALAAAGFRIAIAGNQPRDAERVLAELDLPVEMVAASESWGVHKPSAAFFERLCQELSLAPTQIAYVGDRLDNDILPANAAGMTTIFLKRGPWGYRDAKNPEIATADVRIDSLEPLPDLLMRWNDERN
jgi:HAD superfamily hydrolase (TIGR01662 family)